jgi:transposase
VLTVDQREQVRRAYFIEVKCIRGIAREGLHDRRTVRKFLSDAGPPRYTLKVPRRRPVLEPFLPVIHQWLEEDKDRPTKQRHTAHRIYDRLVSEFGFTGGESTVRQYVREVRPRREVMIPLDHDPGEAQVDWGEAQVYLGRPSHQGALVLSAAVLLATILCDGLPQGKPGSFLRRSRGRI